MSPTQEPGLKQAIEAWFEARVGASSESRVVAEAAISTFQFMAARVTSVVGERGLEILLGRTLHLGGARFHWLVADDDYRVGVMPLATLRGRLASQSAAVAQEASVFLLMAWGDGLASLIGRPLTVRLLASNTTSIGSTAHE